MSTFWSFVAVVVLFLIVRTFVVLKSSKSNFNSLTASKAPDPVIHGDPIITMSDRDLNASLNEDHEEWSAAPILGSMPRSIERHFYAKIAGASHKNDDGTSRIAAIKQCFPGTMLDSAWEYDNPFDPNAVAISLNGHQLGYLDTRLAGETVRDAKRHGWRQLHYFVHANHDPANGAINGATIFVVRLEPEIK